LVAERQADFTHKGLTFTLQLSADVPHQIWTDKEQLARLFGILIGNAHKFTDQGTVTLDVSRHDSDSGKFVLFDLTDSGTGIAEGMLERIFEPFVQGDGSLTRRFGGVGLGLSIARQIAMLLNGHLWAEHAPGGGSSFKFRLQIIVP
jgi:signal transduction histidine kinase